MAVQPSLFPEFDSSAKAPAAAGAFRHERSACAGYVSVVLDIPARALSEPFTYGVPEQLRGDVAVGCTVLVSFGRRMAIGYVVARAEELSSLPGTQGLGPQAIKPIVSVLSSPRFSAVSAQVAFWMSREYVACVSECLRLFLPPGATPRLVHKKDGSWQLERAAVSQVQERWVSLTEAGRAFEPAARATRQRQLIDALRCGPVTTRELNVLYTDMSAAIRSLSAKGVVAVEERRAWRGCEQHTTLSSARAQAPKRLTDGQRVALETILEAYDSERGDVVVIDGVTGSGKTEVYLAAIERVLADGKSACVLVPEISLTAQTVGRFRSRFGGAVAVFHSRLSAGERLDQWDMVRSGAARVVVGARSALFCPFQDLGIIIIDEEHEQSYKQGSSPRYHAREVAAEMARRYRVPLVLGSATPSAEAQYRCELGSVGSQTWRRIEMRERPGGAVLPSVEVVDLRREFTTGSRSIFSRALAEALEGVVERREKAVLLHNRRGFAPFLMCRECGCVPTCKHCSTALTYHERTHMLVCHTCGTSYHVRSYPAPGSACPQCGSRYLAKMGLGTQQVEDALRALLPAEVAVVRMDADSTRGKDAHKRLLEEFDAADCAVLLGTQMIAKGLDFPEVTLVGVVNADYALNIPDFRASERAFDLLEQVAGRAGRGDKPGRVIIQTYLPDHPVIRAVAGHDRDLFAKFDATQRKEAVYPPYVRLANIVAWGKDERRCRDFIEGLAVRVRAGINERFGQPEGARSAANSLWNAGAENILPANAWLQVSPCGASAFSRPQVLGPTACVLERAKDRFRFHFMVKYPLAADISDILSRSLADAGQPRDISVAVDVDAYELM